MGILQNPRENERTVSDDLSVIGYDGIEVSELLEISTVQQPMQEMGQLGVYKLQELIENPRQQPELIRLETTLIERRSTGLAPFMRV